MKKKAPIWLNFFAVSVSLLFFVILFMTIYFIYQTVNKENYIVESNVTDNLYYADLNVSRVLKRYNEQLGSVSVSESLYNAKKDAEGSVSYTHLGYYVFSVFGTDYDIDSFNFFYITR